jgi:hypothetical protein
VKTRKLLVVGSDKEVGSVGFDNDKFPFFKKQARPVFAFQRVRAPNDAALMDDLLKDGWSNGYLYLGPVEEE